MFFMNAAFVNARQYLKQMKTQAKIENTVKSVELN